MVSYKFTFFILKINYFYHTSYSLYVEVQKYYVHLLSGYKLSNHQQMHKARLLMLLLFLRVVTPELQTLGSPLVIMSFQVGYPPMATLEFGALAHQTLRRILEFYLLITK